MTDRPYLLAIDIGTQSVGAFAFDTVGSLVSSFRSVYDQPYVSPHPGWAEQDPDHYLIKLGEACQGLWRRGGIDPAMVAGASITSQRSTVINLDDKGRPLRPAIVWLDQRQAGKLPALPGHLQCLFNLLGLGPTTRYFRAEAEANWIWENQPEVWDKTAHYLFLSGYAAYRMTGRFVDSIGCQVGYIPFDYKKHAWLKEGNWKWRAIRIKTGTLPELTPPGSPLGTVTAEASRLTGLPEGLPLIAGASDKACEVLGSGCLTPEQGCIGYGTTATINVNSGRYLEPIPLIPSYPSALPGSYNLEVQIYRGFWMVTWFKEQFCHKEIETAREQGVDPEVVLEQMARRVPAGSLGLTLQPYWTPGVRSPGPHAKGSIIGFGSAHRKEHLYRALLEGLAYGLREGRDRIEKKTKTRISELYICGGGSKSDLMMQITADVFGVRAVRPSVHEASALGAAILAAVGTGAYPDFEGAVTAMTGKREEFEPDADSSRVYDDLYKSVYSRIYPRLRNQYKDIMRITGYPGAAGK